jgi:hypothetical protein
MLGFKNASTVVGLILVIAVVMFLQSRRPRREGMQAGSYPMAVDTPLLHGWYKTNPDPRVDSFGAEQIHVNYPVFSARHCGTNNIRYWRRPTNGQCTPPGLCMGLYEATEQEIPGAPEAPSWDNPAIRVNYYESAPSVCAVPRND